VDGQAAMIAETVDRVYSTDIVTEAAAGGEMEAMRLVASVPLDIEDEEDTKTLKEQGNMEELDKLKADHDEYKRMSEWLVAERSYKADVASWIAAENMTRVTAIEEAEKQEVLKDVPENIREVIKDQSKDDIVKLVEAMKQTPAKAETPPAGEQKESPKPGEEGYKRHFFD